jgi:hypothetical protein
MQVTIFKWTKIAAGLIGIALLTFSAVRVYDTQRGLPLEPWHTFVPHEMRAEKLQDADGKQYLAAEAKIFDDVRREVSQKLEAGDRLPANRYFDGSPVYPAHFAQDFNRLICA